MKVSELIKSLTAILAEHGDIKVEVQDGDSEDLWYTDANEVLVYTYSLGTAYERTVVQIEP